MSWAEARAATAETTKLVSITTVAIRGSHVGSEISRLAASFDEVYVDAGGRDTVSQRSALVVADRFLAPFAPRAQDLWTADLVVEMLRGAQAVNPKLTALAVISRADSRGSRNDEACALLAEHADILPVAAVRIGDRRALAMLYSDGLGIAERPTRDTKALAEITELLKLLRGESEC
jgi:chromosome partitioning protein